MLFYRVPGFLLVAFGAALWGTDALFRLDLVFDNTGLAFELPTAVVVFWEHVILAVLTLPLVVRFIRRKPQLSRPDILALLVVGVGSSALATMLFTQAFTYGNPTTPLLLQKLQPVVAILGAQVLLSERLLPRFGIYFLSAVGGAYLISFSDPTNVGIDEYMPALYAIGAASLWGLGTVLGRRLTAKIAPSDLTGLRFAIGLVGAGVFVVLKGEASSAASIGAGDIAQVLLLALIPGLAALTIYYQGLARTPASAATLAELAFPLTAIFVNWWAFQRTPDGSQWIGIAILATTIVVMGMKSHGKTDGLGVKAPMSLAGQQRR